MGSERGAISMEQWGWGNEQGVMINGRGAMSMKQWKMDLVQ